MQRSLRARLIWFMAVLCALISLALTAGSYWQMRDQMIGRNLTTEITGTARDTVRLFSAWIEVRRAIVEAGAAALARSAEPQRTVAQIARSGRFQAAYLGTADGRMITDHDMGIPAGYNPARRTWYTDNVRAAGPVMLPPYIDISTGKLVVSFVAPVRNGNVLAGMLGTDVPLDDLVRSILDIRLPGAGYALLVGGDGAVLVHRDTSLVGKPAGNLSSQLAPGALTRLVASRQIVEASLGGVARYLYAEQVPGTGIVLVLVVDKAAALAPLDSLLLRSVLIFVVLLALVLPLAVLLLGRLLGGLRHIHDTMTDIAAGEGDLTRTIQIAGNDEIARTAQAFNRFLDTLRRMFVDVRLEADRLTEGMDRISGLLGSVAADSRVLATLTAENAASIEQITVSISHIADHAGDADKLVQDTGALSGESSRTVREVADEVGRSAREVGELAALLDRLSERSQEISGIIRVIKDIADQTNLLALNAAIEAVRAGEAGRGFAVVADEVRKLAERTARATIEITGMIEGIHQEMHQAVSDMQRTLQTVQSGAGASGRTAGNIERIRDYMDRVMEKMNEIALSTREQLAATTAMAQGAEKVTGQMQNSDEALQRAAAEVGDLNRRADGLRRMFGRFRL